MRRQVTLTLAVLALLAASATATTQPLRPGDPLGIPASCTLNFVFYGGGATYIGTAAHCVDGPGQVVENQAHGRFGVVDVVDPRTDFALIVVDEDEAVDPQVIEIGGPTGIARARGDTLTGDVLQMYGNGVGVGLTVQTRPRSGVLVSDNETEFWWNTVATLGDSGAPVIMQGNGLAIGIVSQVGLTSHQSTDSGPTIAYVLTRLAELGRPVTLATAPHL